MGLPNLLSSLLELMGIELGASRFRPSTCRYDRAPNYTTAPQISSFSPVIPSFQSSGIPAVFFQPFLQT